MVDPAVEKLVNKIYNQTLNRTYHNTNGDRVMLAIAYGSNQSDAMEVHKPEICYPDRGFQVTNLIKTLLPLPDHQTIPIKRLVATQGNRIEPITYWTTVGNKVEVDSLKSKLAQIRYGLTGVIPDGLLFRVSSIDPNVQHAYAVQDDFTNQLINTLNTKSRTRIIGDKNAVQ